MCIRDSVKRRLLPKLRLKNQKRAEKQAAPCEAELRFQDTTCLLYTSDAADERSSVDLGGRCIIKKKN